jgi:hypothetical protein
MAAGREETADKTGNRTYLHITGKRVEDKRERNEGLSYLGERSQYIVHLWRKHYRTIETL